MEGASLSPPSTLYMGQGQSKTLHLEAFRGCTLPGPWGCKITPKVAVREQSCGELGNICIILYAYGASLSVCL